MLAQIRPALVLLLLMTVLTGVVYPLAITGIAQSIWPQSAHGSLLRREARIVGSELIGQSFSAPGYFHSRPSAAGEGLRRCIEQWNESRPDESSTAHSGSRTRHRRQSRWW